MVDSVRKNIEISGDLGRQMLIVQKDQLLVQSITEFAIKYNIVSAQITGLGAVKDVELGYYHLETREYDRRVFTGEDYELVSLTGNIALKEGKAFVHVHCSIAGQDFIVKGGHLFEASVAVVAEVFITPLGVAVHRQHDPQIGLFSICGIK